MDVDFHHRQQGRPAHGLACGPLIRRFDTRTVSCTGMTLVVASMFTLALAAHLAVLPLAWLALLLFGLGMGSAELAINMEGADVERLTGRIILPTLHGCFSLGTVIGALAGLGLMHWQVPDTPHLLIMGALGLIVLLLNLRGLPGGFGKETADTDDAAGTGARPLWREPVVLMIGAIALAMTLAEGSAYDWLPLLMADAYGTGERTGTLVFLGFATTMAIGRLGSRFLLERMDRRRLMTLSLLAGAAGMAVVITSNQLGMAVAGVILWGLGASVAFPLALSAAAASGPNPNARVKLVATGGYIALLVGPPMLGFVANALGLRGAFPLVLALVLLAILALPAIARGRGGAH